MKKLIVEETYPRSEIAKNMIYNKMKSHYRRLSRARPKVDTNLPKPPKNTLPLSREISEIVDRNYHCYKDLPKHRCLKELENSHFQFKPLILSTSTESKLKSLINVYHPPVRTPRRKKSREGNQDKLAEPNQSVNEGINLAEVDDSNDTKEPEEQKTVIENIPIVSKKEMFVQTDHLPRYRKKGTASYRPTIQALHFLRDITDDVLRKGVYTNASLEEVFNRHVSINTHNLDVGIMEIELNKLRDQVGMPRPGLRNSIHSDEEALDALASLCLDPTLRQEIINSLRLHNTENYHNAIIESQISIESPSSSKHLEIVEKPKLLEKSQAASLKERFLPDNLDIENKGEVVEDIGEMTSTTSEVSDIQEIEFEDIKKIIDDIEEEKEEDEENHSMAVKTITQSLSAVKSEAAVCYEENSQVNKSIHDTNSEMLSHSENNKNKEKSIISEVEESKDEEESIMELKILEIEGISQKKEDDIKSITKNTDDHSSVKTDIKTELQSEEITEEEVGSEDTAEEEEEEEVVVDDEDDIGKFETEEKSSRTKELAKSDSSSDMSSIKTEDSDN